MTRSLFAQRAATGLRLVGGRLPVTALIRLLSVSEQYADGQIHLTKRADLQVRGLPGGGRELPPTVLIAIESTGTTPTLARPLGAPS